MQAPNHLVRALIVGVAAAMPSAARAGAWSAEKQTIGSVAYGDRDAGRFIEADYYHERQVAPRVGLVAQTHADIAAEYDQAGWRGEQLVGLKWSPLKPERGAVAVQTALTWTYEPSAACQGGGWSCTSPTGRMRHLIFHTNRDTTSQGGVSFGSGLAFTRFCASSVSAYRSRSHMRPRT